MEIVVTVVSFALIIALMLSPIAILSVLRRLDVNKYKFLAYLAFGTIMSLVITFMFAWWSDTSNEILLSHYGYDFEALNYNERFANVSAENLERVKSLELSRMGIGWPLKAVMTFRIYSPYILIIYLTVYLIQKIKKSVVRGETS